MGQKQPWYIGKVFVFNWFETYQSYSIERIFTIGQVIIIFKVKKITFLVTKKLKDPGHHKIFLLLPN